MRILLLALMMTLLPVRGWVGNVMAVDMAAQQSLAIAAPGPTGLVSDASAMPPDCPMHAQAANEETPVQATCASCDTCQLCLALASLTWHAPAKVNPAPHAGPPGNGERFASFDGISSFKPPIS